jgi:hypothetical protein
LEEFDLQRELDKLKRLSGIPERPEDTMSPLTSINRGAYQKKHNVKPGPEEWFKLWFAKPGLTGENPTPKDD